VAVEVNSPDPAEVDPPVDLEPPASDRPALEAALAPSALREDDVVDDAGAETCSGPNSRLALAAGGSAVDTPARVKIEGTPPRRARAVASGTGWTPAMEELRAS
jgi:hypothetical protein